jgi:hypothetical protein
MPEPQVASLINMDTILSWTHFNTLEKKTKASMMMIAIFSGHQVLVFYKYRLLGIKGFDDDFFAHRKRLICAGVH